MSERASTVANPAGARKWGLVPVYQEPSLIPDLTVADNLRLGDTPVGKFRHWVSELGISDLRMEDMIGRLDEAMSRWHEEVPLEEKVISIYPNEVKERSSWLGLRSVAAWPIAWDSPAWGSEPRGSAPTPCSTCCGASTPSAPG